MADEETKKENLSAVDRMIGERMKLNDAIGFADIEDEDGASEQPEGLTTYFPTASRSEDRPLKPFIPLDEKTKEILLQVSGEKRVVPSDIAPIDSEGRMLIQPIQPEGRPKHPFQINEGKFPLTYFSYRNPRNLTRERLVKLGKGAKRVSDYFEPLNPLKPIRLPVTLPLAVIQAERALKRRLNTGLRRVSPNRRIRKRHE